MRRAIALIPVALLIVGAIFVGFLRRSPPGQAPSVADARAFYAAQPRYLQPVPASALPAGLPNLRASTCGICHRAIYEEWKISTHARAWLDDAQFQAELEKSKRGGKDVAWMCINCHTPVEAQLPRLVTGLVGGDLSKPTYIDNPSFDPELQLEAITCATCHVRDGVVLGPTGEGTSPHPIRKSEDLLGPAVCTQCHQARASFPELALECAFDTGSEHANSVYSERDESCQSCHMPEVERPIADGFPPRRTRRHWFGGSLIPKKPELESEIAPLRAIFGDGLDVRWIDLPERAKPGDELVLLFEIENARAGHMLPTGDPERFLLVTARAASDGQPIAERRERIGTVYEWHPEVKKLDDNRLAPLEKRRFELRFSVPEAERVLISLEASKWRISPENFAYHRLDGRYVAGRVFMSQTATIAVD